MSVTIQFCQHSNFVAFLSQSLLFSFIVFSVLHFFKIHHECLSLRENNSLKHWKKGILKTLRDPGSSTLYQKSLQLWDTLEMIVMAQINNLMRTHSNVYIVRASIRNSWMGSTIFWYQSRPLLNHYQILIQMIYIFYHCE